MSAAAAASSEPRRRVAFRSVGWSRHRAAGGPRVEPSGVPRPRGDRPPCGRGGSVEPRPHPPSGSAWCLDRGSHDQMPGLPGITTR